MGPRAGLSGCGKSRRPPHPPGFDPRPVQKTEISLPSVWPFDLSRDALAVRLNTDDR
jgi:hypothetical protein